MLIYRAPALQMVQMVQMVPDQTPLQTPVQTPVQTRVQTPVVRWVSGLWAR